jgi:hypothetical protein
MLRRGRAPAFDFYPYLVNLAAARGKQSARSMRDMDARRMTPEQIAEAQRLAREWKPKQ